MIKTWPDYSVGSFRWKKMSNAVVSKSVFGSQALETAIPVWQVEMTGVPEYREDARQIGAFIDSLDGYSNQLALWNVEHPVPDGTMRGTMTLSASAAQGATSLSIVASGQGGKTLLAGDYVGLGDGLTQQVVRVESDATANGSGVIVVSVNIPLRNAFMTGAAVEWDKPKALFRQSSLFDGIEYTPEFGQPWAMSLIEDYRP